MGGEKLLGIAVWPDPAAAGSAAQKGAPQLVAVAGARAQSRLVVDAGRTPELWTSLAAGPPLAIAEAGPLARALLAAGLALPARWAALDVGHMLLRAQGVLSPSVAEVALQLRLSPPPDGVAAPEELVARAAFAHTAAMRQAEALVARGAAAVSRLEAGVLAPLARLEHAGIALDEGRLRRLLAAEGAEAKDLSARLARALKLQAGELGRGPQLALQALRRAGHTPASWSSEDLERGLQVANAAEVARALLRHATLVRLQSALGEGLLTRIDPRDGRVHATFVQMGAQTGRMACRAPNLQAVPKAFERRACFVPAPGCRFVLADYAACELRILAEMSADAAYLAAFARGDDVHAQVAETMFRTQVDRTTRPELREAAKMLSFGLVYGMQPAGLASRLGCSRTEAEELTETFFAAYPTVRAYLVDSEATALERGWAETLAGRRLLLPASPDSSAAQKAARGRLARNMPIQGTGADIIKLALAGTQRALDAAGNGARVVHCVHDALVVECPADAAEATAVCVGRAMRAAGEPLLRRVRLEADPEVAGHWA